MIAHDFAQLAQCIMLLDNDLAVEQHIFDARIEIRQEQRLLHMEILERIFRLCVHLSRPRRDDVLAERLLEMRITDGRTDRVCIRISMANDINGFRILHPEKSSL